MTERAWYAPDPVGAGRAADERERERPVPVVIGWQPGAVFVDVELQDTPAARELGDALRGDDPLTPGLQIILT